MTMQLAEAPPHQRHLPEQTLLYTLVEQHYPAFIAALAEAGRTLPRYVEREFEDFLKCGRLEYGFLRVRCNDCHAEKLVAFSCKRRGFCPSCGARRMVESAALLVDEVLPDVPIRQWVFSVPFPLRFLFANDPAAMGAALGVVYRCIARLLRRKAGFKKSRGHCGAVTLIQRFGSALNLNVHFHMLVPDGVYVKGESGPTFHAVAAPTSEEMQRLVRQISQRLGRQLERKGVLVRDVESSYLSLDLEGQDALTELPGHSITYRIALGAQRGRKAFQLQTLPPRSEERSESVAQASGFSLHAGVATQSGQRDRLERICRYVSRSAVANDRLSLTAKGKVRYALKSAYRDGTTHVIFERCGGPMKIIASIENPVVIGKILQHLQEQGEYVAALRGRGPPLGLLEGID